MDNIAEMLRVKRSHIERINIEHRNLNQLFNNTAIINLRPKPLVFFNRLKYFFGPVGPYIKWSWYLFSPTILIVIFYILI